MEVKAEMSLAGLFGLFLFSLLEATFSTTNMTFKPASFEEEHME